MNSKRPPTGENLIAFHSLEILKKFCRDDARWRVEVSLVHNDKQSRIDGCRSPVSSETDLRQAKSRVEDETIPRSSLNQGDTHPDV